MLSQKILLSVLIISGNLLCACAQQKDMEQTTEVSTNPVKEPKTEKATAHSFGGWYCPDNLGGFPPVNTAELGAVPVVKGRMPTQDEASNGTSLMYFDPDKYPTAKPLDMELPKLARYYTNFSDQKEIVVVIQAVVVDNDTVVGFRYLNGGNGTSWYREVEFLTDIEVKDFGPTPFVFLETSINATKEKVWNAIIKTDYAKELGERFHEQAFFDSEWSKDKRINLETETANERANGNVSLLFGNIYLQVNNVLNGHPFVEKVLLLNEDEGKTSKIQVVFGPYLDGYEAENQKWQNWIEEVKRMSEAG